MDGLSFALRRRDSDGRLWSRGRGLARDGRVGPPRPPRSPARRLDRNRSRVLRMTSVSRTERIFDNRAAADRFTPSEGPTRNPLAFHQRLPGYAPTSLVEATGIAAHLGCEQVWIKNETERLGLPAFKIMGASWATYRALLDLVAGRTGSSITPPSTLDGLKTALGPMRQLTLTCATDGNHGRAVAHMAESPRSKAKARESRRSTARTTMRSRVPLRRRTNVASSFPILRGRAMSMCLPG
jgi:Pyridoxal-phosphate dependent enzyme